jgi:hypothetical protein
MKILIASISVLFFILSCNLDNKNNYQSQKQITLTENSNKLELSDNDTIFIENEFASNPFLFKSWNTSLDSIINHLPKGVEIEISTKPSKYHENQLDSTFVLAFESSKIVYEKTPSVGFIKYANIKDGYTEFRYPIRIGDIQDKIVDIFSELNNIEKHYKVVQIAFGDGTSYLYLEFDKGKLISITYCPYYG